MRKILGCACVATLMCASHTMAGSFIFSSNANGLTGAGSGVLTDGGLTLNIDAGMPGAVFDESDSDGMGLNSAGVAGVTDDSDSKFNILGGSAAGVGESITFSFDQPGVLNTLLFDGLKDETLENFALELPNGTVLTLFDFEVEYRLNLQGFNLSDMGVPNPTQAIDSSDDIIGLNIPFAAGEVFTLTYGEVDYNGAVLPGYYPADDNLVPTGDTPNGSRFEGIVATLVPEPGTLLIGLTMATACAVRRR